MEHLRMPADDPRLVEMRGQIAELNRLLEEKKEEVIMPISRPKSLIELYRRVNRLIKEQRRKRNTVTWTPEVKQRITDLFPRTDSQKSAAEAGRSKARTKK
jgi:hypothetical protein